MPSWIWQSALPLPTILLVCTQCPEEGCIVLKDVAKHLKQKHGIQKQTPLWKSEFPQLFGEFAEYFISREHARANMAYVTEAVAPIPFIQFKSGFKCSKCREIFGLDTMAGNHMQLVHNLYKQHKRRGPKYQPRKRAGKTWKAQGMEDSDEDDEGDDGLDEDKINYDSERGASLRLQHSWWQSEKRMSLRMARAESATSGMSGWSEDEDEEEDDSGSGSDNDGMTALSVMVRPRLGGYHCTRKNGPHRACLVCGFKLCLAAVQQHGTFEWSLTTMRTAEMATLTLTMCFSISGRMSWRNSRNSA
jgi:hypothetical protein